MFHHFSLLDISNPILEYDHCGCVKSISNLSPTTEETRNVWINFKLRTKWS